MKKIMLVIVIFCFLFLTGCKEEEQPYFFENSTFVLDTDIEVVLENDIYIHFNYIQRVNDTEFVLWIDDTLYLYDINTGETSLIDYDFDQRVLVAVDGINRNIIFSNDNVLNKVDFDGNVLDSVEFDNDIYVKRIENNLVINEDGENEKIHLYGIDFNLLHTYDGYLSFLYDSDGMLTAIGQNEETLYELVDDNLVELGTVENRKNFTIMTFEDNYFITPNSDGEGNFLMTREYYIYDGEDITMFHSGPLTEFYNTCGIEGRNPYFCFYDTFYGDEASEQYQNHKVFDSDGNLVLAIDNLQPTNEFIVISTDYYQIKTYFSKLIEVFDMDGNEIFEYQPGVVQNSYTHIDTAFDNVFISEFDYGVFSSKLYMYDDGLIELSTAFIQSFSNQPIVYQFMDSNTMYLQRSVTDITEITGKDINDIDDTTNYFLEVFNDTIRYETGNNTYMVYSLEGDFLYEYRVVLEATNYLFGSRFATYNDMKYMVVEYVETGELELIEVENTILLYD